MNPHECVHMFNAYALADGLLEIAPTNTRRAAIGVHVHLANAGLSEMWFAMGKNARGEESKRREEKRSPFDV